MAMNEDSKNNMADRTWEEDTQHLRERLQQEWARSQVEQERVAELIRKIHSADARANHAVMDVDKARKAGKDLLEKLNQTEAED